MGRNPLLQDSSLSLGCDQFCHEHVTAVAVARHELGQKRLMHNGRVGPYPPKFADCVARTPIKHNSVG